MALQVAGGSFRIEPDGSANIQVDGEESSCRGFHLLTPNAFQESKGSGINVRSRFRLDDKGHLRFDVAEYDPHLPLIIDPVVSYSKIIGTNNETEVGAIQIDPAGDVFITGQTFATNYPVAGAVVGPGVGSGQVYLTKLDPSGTRILYSTYLPAPGFSSASSIAVDPSGNAYVAGVAGDAGFPTTSANLGTCSTFCNAGFIAKFDDAGALVYSTLIGSGQLPKDITVDDSGNVYVAGLSADAGLITVNAFQPGYNAGLCTTCGSPFSGKLNPTGTAWIFSSYFYSAGRLNDSTYANAIARDTSGNIYLAGNGDSVPIKGSLQYGMGGSFAAEFGPDGRTLLFSTLLGGTTITEDSLSGLQVAPDGTIYLAGSQIAEDFPYTANAYRLSTYPIGYAQSKQYIFASAINPQHTGYSWSTFLGQGSVTATSIDQKGNFYVGGTFSIGSVLYKDALASDSTTGAYIIQLDPAGGLVNATSLGGKNTYQVPSGLRVDSNGNIILAGVLNGAYWSGGDPADPLHVGTGSIYAEQNNLSSYSTMISKISPPDQPQISLSYRGPVLALRNAGSADLHISSIEPGSTITSLGNTCGSTVAAGTSCYLTPLSTSPNGSLTINTDALPASQTFTPVGLSSSLGPVVIVDGSQLNFPPVQTGTTSAPRPLIIRNVGSASVTLTSILTFGFFTQTNNCPGVLAAGAFCTAMVTVTPATNGSNSSDIGVVYNGNARIDVYANFTQNPAAGPLLLSIDGYGINYGNVFVGTTSLIRTVTVTNSGMSPVAVDAPVLSGDGSSNFSIVANTCSDALLQPQGSCVIGATFHPTAAGLLTVPLLISGGGSSQTLHVVGTGITPPPHISVTPGSSDLGNVIVGSSVTQTLQVKNNNATALSLTGIVAGLADGAAEGDFTQQNDCPANLAAQAACTITVSFAPSGVGLRKGTVSLVVNGGVLNQNISIVGTGILPVVATPSTVAFSSTLLGSSSLQTVTLSNQSTTAQPFTLAIADPFSIKSTTCGSPLAAGAQCVISIGFQAESVGVQTSALTVLLANSLSLTVPLSATTANPEFSVAAPSTPPTVSAGSPATYALSFQPDAGFNGVVTLSCSGLPSYAACSFSPSTLPLSGGSATSLLTVTTAQTQSASVPSNTRLPLGAISLSTLLLVPFARSRSRKFIFSLAIVLVVGFAGCSSSKTSTTTTQPPTSPPTTNRTPTGTYSFNVVATSGAISRTVPLSLNVQ